MPVLVATITPKPDKVDEVVAAFREAVAEVHGEEGCELYALHRSGDKLVMVEKWASDDALRAHSTGEPYRALGKKLRDLVEGRPELMVLEPVPAGDATKGAL
ncbi:MAG TPA: putative quinol monooxygenase [Acidimicrobiales bacterium]|nr:putative quinol monooxygenase [Acidimicrobiales bacterium]